MKQFGPVEAGKEVRSTTVCSHFNKRHVYNTTCRKKQTWPQILKNEGKTSTAEGFSCCFKIHMEIHVSDFFSGEMFCLSSFEGKQRSNKNNLQVVKHLSCQGISLLSCTWRSRVIGWTNPSCGKWLGQPITLSLWAVGTGSFKWLLFLLLNFRLLGLKGCPSSFLLQEVCPKNPPTFEAHPNLLKTGNLKVSPPWNQALITGVLKPSFEQWKKGLVVSGRGWNPTQLNVDYNQPL